jgi:hypothetical protein
MIKRVLQIFLIIILINLLAWFIIGRSNTLFLTLDFFDDFGPYTELDTLFVPSNNFLIDVDDQRHDFTKLSVFSDTKRDKFLQELSEVSGAKKTIYLDGESALFPDYVGEHHNLFFFTDIERNFPLYAKVNSGVTVYRYVSQSVLSF